MADKPGDFTDEQKQRYLDKQGMQCPACHSSRIVAGQLEDDGDRAWCNVICCDCHEEFTDVYKLVDVERLQVPEKVGG
jgi:hypothetical protein